MEKHRESETMSFKNAVSPNEHNNQSDESSSAAAKNAKVRLAVVMNREHNWLVLDEPTNHLDVDAKKELQRALREYPGQYCWYPTTPCFYEDFITRTLNVGAGRQNQTMRRLPPLLRRRQLSLRLLSHGQSHHHGNADAHQGSRTNE